MKKIINYIMTLALIFLGAILVSSCGFNETITSYYNGENEIRVGMETDATSSGGKRVVWRDNHGNIGRLYKTGTNKYDMKRHGHRVNAGSFETWDEEDTVTTSQSGDFTLSAYMDKKKLTIYYNDTEVTFSSTKGEINDIPDDTVIVMDDKIYGFVPGCSKSSITLNQASEIVEYAFYLDPTLKEVTIENNINKIGKAAFCGSNVITATVGANITEMPLTMFAKCDKLKNVKVLPFIKCVNESCFDGAKSLENVEIHFDEKAVIKKNAFTGTSISDFYIQSAVDEIEMNAFNQDTKLYCQRSEVYGDLKANSFTTDTNHYVFYDVNFFSTHKTDSGEFKYLVSTDGTVTLISYEGDSDTVIIPSNIDGRPIKEVYWRCFNHLSNLKKVYFTGSVSTINKYAIYACRNLEDIYIGKNVENILAAVEQACNDTFIIHVEDDKAKDEWSITWAGDAKKKNIFYSAKMQ